MIAIFCSDGSRNSAPGSVWLRRPPSQEEVTAEAEELLYNFTIEEFRSQNVDTSNLGLPVRP